MKFNIRLKLLSSFGLILALTASVCFYALYEMHALAALTAKLYNHPLRVTRAVLSADAGIVKMHRSMKDVALAKDTTAMEIAQEAVNNDEKEVYTQLDVVKEWILGEEGAVLIANTIETFRQWAPIRNEVIELMKAGQRDAAAAITKGKGARHVALLNTEMGALRDYAADKAIGMYNNAETVKKRVTSTTAAALAAAVIISTLLGFLISRGLAGAIQIITRIATDMAAGDTALKNVKREEISRLVLRPDEMGDIGRGMDEVSRYFQNVITDIVQVSEGLARGDLNAKPEAEYRGDFIKIKESLKTALPDQRKIIEDIVQVSQGLAQGDLRVTPRGDYKGDFARVKQALESTLLNLREVIDDIVMVSRALAEDKRNITPAADYKGDFTQIKDALDTAALKLAETARKNAVQDWLKSGQTRLNEKIGGEQDTLSLAENMLSFIAEYLEAQMGVCYLYQEGSGEKEGRLKLIAAYAYTERKNTALEFKIGEGLVGQAALERQAIVVEQVPDDYMRIQSGLGEAVPGYIIVYPILYEGALQAVLELASIKAMEKNKLEFLEQVMPGVGVALNSAESRGRMQTLLAGGRSNSKTAGE